MYIGICKMYAFNLIQSKFFIICKSFPKQALVFMYFQYNKVFCGNRRKLLITSNFSFSHIVFYAFGELSIICINLKIVVCKLFQLKSQNMSFEKGSRVKVYQRDNQQTIKLNHFPTKFTCRCLVRHIYIG